MSCVDIHPSSAVVGVVVVMGTLMMPMDEFFELFFVAPEEETESESGSECES